MQTDLDSARAGRRCADGDRPAQEPGGLECQRCQCIFIGEEWHEFCALCIAIVAQEIAASQGEIVIREPEYPCDSGSQPKAENGEAG